MMIIIIIIIIIIITIIIFRQGALIAYSGFQRGPLNFE